MTTEELERRMAVVIEARSWLGTPYVLGARIRGAGCDCVTLIAEVMISAHIMPAAAVNGAFAKFGNYSGDWFHNTTTQRYLLAIMRFGKHMMDTRCFANNRVEAGNIILTKCAQSKNWNHGGIVVQWPHVVHAYSERVSEVDVSVHHVWTGNEIAVLDPFVQVTNV